MKQSCINCIYADLLGEVITYKEKDVIFLEGNELLYSYLLIDGLVKISKHTITGEEKIFDIFGPKDFMALVAMLKNDTEYVASAVCLTDVTVKQLTKTDVLETYRANNEFKDACINCAMMRTNLFQSQLFNSSNTDVEERIILMLMYLSKKFGKVKDNVYTINLPFSKTTLASIIGIRRETLSRKLSNMQKDGMIDIDKTTYKFYRI